MAHLNRSAMRAFSFLLILGFFVGMSTRAMGMKTPETATSTLATEAVPEAALLIRFDEAKWRIAERNERRGAVLRRLSLLNDSEEKRLSILTPRVGERVTSLSELADSFAMQIDEPRPPKRAKIDFLGREAIFISGVAINHDRTIKRNRAIVVFFSGGEEWCIIYSCRAEVEPSVTDILSLVGPLK